MPAKPFLPVLYELARTFQVFDSFSAGHIRELGLTPSQFDIIATLGNTQGMTFKDLGDKTLITKGTLTGVVDRLEDKKLVKRVACPKDGRRQYVQLTVSGQQLFEKVFPAHLAYLEQVFADFSQQDFDQAVAMLQKLKQAFHSKTQFTEEQITEEAA